MCREYKFRFAECGHIYSSAWWRFKWVHHPEDRPVEDAITDRPQHRFQSLHQDNIPESRRNFYDYQADLDECTVRDEWFIK
jgi:hypothetical protein